MNRVLLSGKIITSAEGRANFLLYESDRIIAVGSTEEMSTYLGDDVRVVELGECVAIPGLMDSHIHLVQTGLSCLNVDLTVAKDKDDALSLLAEETKGKPEIVVGFGFDESRWPVPQLPTLKDLDKVSMHIPVFISRRDSHLFVTNTPTIQKFANALQGEELNEENTHLGIFRGELGYKLLREVFLLMSEERKTEGVKEACRRALRRGITALHAMEGGKLFGEGDARLVQKLIPALSLDIIVYPQIMGCDVVQEMGLPRIGGCLLVDGSIGARTAALQEPYSDQAENSGVLYFSDQELSAFTKQANRRGLQIALHAIGDRAIEQTLRAYKNTLEDHPRQDHRLRIEHFELGTDEQIERCAEMGIVLGMQPTFERLWGGKNGMYAERLGERLTNRIKTIMRAGIVVSGGSDSQITPNDSLLGMASAMSHPNPEERLSFVEALQLYTQNCAYAGFQEKAMGTLEEGRRANISVLCKDPQGMTAEELAIAEVEVAIVGGVVQYQREDCRLKL